MICPGCGGFASGVDVAVGCVAGGGGGEVLYVMFVFCDLTADLSISWSLAS